MDASRFLFLVLTSLCICLPAWAFQITKSRSAAPQSISRTDSQTAEDELQRHLSAAETYQLAGDVDRASAENKMVVAIALQRLGFIGLEEKDYKKAAKLLGESVALNDKSLTRASLAVAYMRLSENEKAIAEAQAAVLLDPKNVSAHQILGSVYYTKGDYKAALPELETVFQLAPDFEGAYLLGMSYLRLQQFERAKLLFEEIQYVITKKSAYVYLLFARAFEETDYPQEAEAQYKKAISFDPKAGKAHFYYGYFLLQHGGVERTADAEREFQQELLITPNDFYSQFFLGVIASGNNDHPKAVKFLQKAITIDPKIGQAYLFLGQSQLELGNIEAAERSLRRSIELDKDPAKNDYQVRRAYFLLGRLLLKTGRKSEGEQALAKARAMQGQVYEQARDDIKKIFGEVVSSRESELNTETAAGQIGKAPVSVPKPGEYAKVKSGLGAILGQAYHNLGVISVQEGNLVGALDRFATAAEWKPDLPGLDRNWGIVFFRLSQFNKAIDPLSRQIKVDPKDSLARRMLGVSYYFSGNYKKAVDSLRPIESQITDDIELAYFYGISLRQSDLNKDAQILFAKLADRNPKSAQARFYAAQGFVLLGNYEKALEEFRVASELEPRMLRVHYNAAQTLIRLNRLDEAEKQFRLELEINPADETSKYHLAFTLIDRKIQTGEAVALLNEAIQSRPDYADAHYQLGKIYIEKGEIDQAIEHLEAAARSDPKKEYVHYQLSIAYRRASRLSDSERELKIYSDLKATNRQPAPVSGNKKNAP